MKKHYYCCLLLLLNFACGSKDSSTSPSDDCILIRKSLNDYEMGNEFWFVNQTGKIIVPKQKYYGTFNDTIRNYGFVIDNKGNIFAVDCNGNELYQVFKYDNGPDYAEEGLFRILSKNGKIGYADAETGKIVIKPVYQCAFPFENGRARVSKNCLTETIDEYSEWVSDEWFEIDKTGKRIQ